MFKYAKGAFKFIKKNWKGVCSHALIPAIIYSIFILPTSAFDYIIAHLGDFNNANFWDIFTSINDSSQWNRWEYVVFIILLTISTIFIFSSYIGKIQNRMKYGKTVYPGFRGILKRTNENMFATIKSVIAVYIALEIYAFAMSVFMSLILMVTTQPAAVIVLILLVGGLSLVLAMYILAWFSCVLPNMTMRRQGLFRSIPESMRMVSNNIGKIFLNLIIPLIISYIPVIIFASLDIEFNHIALTIIRYVFNFIFFFFSFVYYITIMYVIFFDLNDIEREDLNQENKWRI